MVVLVMIIAAQTSDFVAKERVSAPLPQEGPIVEPDQHQEELELGPGRT